MGELHRMRPVSTPLRSFPGEGAGTPQRLNGLVLGPVLGSDHSASIEAIKKLVDGSIPVLPRFGFNVVDVRDIARLHVLAMTTPEAAGQRFIGSGDFYWMSVYG
jgi:dihydroflavonol-4-reductase